MSQMLMEVPSSIVVILVVILFIPSVLVLPESLAITSNLSLDNFLECLPRESKPRYPISEAIHTHQNTSFQSVLLAYIRNSRYSTPRTPKPLAVVTAKHNSHVQATVICAKRHALQIRIRSGGHDYESLSYVSHVPFVILDMSDLRFISINVRDESAWVESGAIVGELYSKIGNKSKVLGFSASACPSVGAGGHFSAGGYGPMMRKYGLAADNVVDAKIVTVNGGILDRKSMGEDLFWAIRGGGGASFGVILSWKIKLLRVPSKVTVFSVQRTLEQGATEVIYRWQYVAPKLPKEVFIRAMPQVNSTTEGNKTLKVLFIGHYLGQSDSLVSLLSERFPELGLQKTDCFEMSWVESTVFWAGYPAGTPTNVLLDRPEGPGVFFKSKSDYVKKPIPKEGIESIWTELLKTEKMWMQWNPYGGRMSEISESETPFPHRAGNLFLIQYFILWVNETDTNKYLDLSRKFYRTMTPFVSKNPREAYQNYRDLDIGANLYNHTDFNTARAYGRKYFKGNFERLACVKAEVDPQNFFQHEQSIPPLGRR